MGFAQILNMLFRICVIILWSIAGIIIGWTATTAIFGVILGAFIGAFMGIGMSESIIDTEKTITLRTIIGALIGVGLSYFLVQFSNTNHLAWSYFLVAMGATVGAFITLEFGKFIIGAKQGAAFGAAFGFVVGIILIIASIVYAIVYNDWVAILKAIKWSVMMVVVFTILLSVGWAICLAVISVWFNILSKTTEDLES